MRKLAVAVCVVLAAVVLQSPAAAAAALMVGYYGTSCPDVESIVSGVVKSAIDHDRGMGAGLVRLHFHDCFVRGCDASVLLDPAPNSPPPEKMAADANRGLRGFDVIDAAKEAVETTCPGVVSCADIIAFAARDAAGYLSALSGSPISYPVAAGRLDGRVSLATEAAAALPASTSTLPQLLQSFSSRGLSTTDLVALSGVHAVGVSHCASFADRLAANDNHMNSLYRALLRTECGAGPAAAVPQNVRDQSPVDIAGIGGVLGGRLHDVHSVLDNSYYANNVNNLVLFNSDWELVTSKQTLDLMNVYAKDAAAWGAAFGAAMRKMGDVLMPPGSAGEVRRTCRSIN